MALHMAKIDGAWNCVTCAQAFRDKTDLRRHVESKHLPKTVRYRCNLCNWSAKTTYAFRKHQLMHEKMAMRSEAISVPIDPDALQLP